MEENSDFLSIKIIKTFHLFEGQRSRSEDEKIFDKVLTQCFLFLIKYLDKKLSADNKISFSDGLEKGGKGDPVEIRKLIVNAVGSIPKKDRIHLRSELEEFIDHLLKLSLKKDK